MQVWGMRLTVWRYGNYIRQMKMVKSYHKWLCNEYIELPFFV